MANPPFTARPAPAAGAEDFALVDFATNGAGAKERAEAWLADFDSGSEQAMLLGFVKALLDPNNPKASILNLMELRQSVTQGYRSILELAADPALAEKAQKLERFMGAFVAFIAVNISGLSKHGEDGVTH